MFDGFWVGLLTYVYYNCIAVETPADFLRVCVVGCYLAYEILDRLYDLS